jgi:hypothetical protein
MSTSHAASPHRIPLARASQQAGGRTADPAGAATDVRRWVTWFGFPPVLAAVFFASVLVTGKEWLIGPAIVAIIVDIGVLVWLLLSSDTNTVIGEDSPAHH